MLGPLFGYFFSMIAVLTATVVVLTNFSNISMIRNGRNHLRPAPIGRTVTVELQRHSPVANAPSPPKDVAPVAKEASPAKDVSPVVATAKAETKKASITNPKCSPASATTTAMGTRWVMPTNLGTAQKVLFSNDPAHVQSAFNASDTNSRYAFVLSEDAW
jgi:hypothetical protein